MLTISVSTFVITGGSIFYVHFLIVKKYIKLAPESLTHIGGIEQTISCWNIPFIKPFPIVKYGVTSHKESVSLNQSQQIFTWLTFHQTFLYTVRIEA